VTGGQILEKQKYASWKAVDIRKALSEGRKPVPGPPGDTGESMTWNPEVGVKANIYICIVMLFFAHGTLPYLAFAELRIVCLSNVGLISAEWKSSFLFFIMKESFLFHDMGCCRGTHWISFLGQDSKTVSTNVAPDIPSSHLDGNWKPQGSVSVEQPSQALGPSSTSPPLEHLSHQSSSASYDEINLPPVPSPPAYPTHGHDSYAPPGSSVFPSNSSPSDQSNLYPQAPPYSTAGNYSYASDQSGPTSAPPSFASYPSYHDAAGGLPQVSQPSYNPQQNWSNSPFNEPPQPSYPSFFPPGASGYHPATPQYPSTTHEPQDNSGFAGVRPSHTRTTSAPGAPELSGGYNVNGTYDSNYEPTPAQIAEAHKISRFAVSALAFDDIPTAISYLQKALELLTSPSAAS
jgi:vacuolar protein sorting-associated protein VTA1